MTTTLDLDFILSDPDIKIAGVHHPWRHLREHLPDWELLQRPILTGRLGLTDSLTRTITVDSRQMQAQKRCTLDHELLHAEAGDLGCQHPHRERAINIESARRLIPLDALIDCIVWSREDEHEMADELWVDLATVRCRLDNLSEAEKDAIRQAVAIRDFHEEGLNEETP